MGRFQRQSFVVSTAIFIGLIFSFQNCAPAKLSGDPGGSTSSGSVYGTSTVGSKVDLNKLMAAALESSTNIVYPSNSILRESYYSVGNPIIENIVARSNDFDRIEWIQGSSSTVLSNNANFSPRSFSNDLLGMVLIFGYRGSVPFFLGQMRFANRGSTTLNVNSVGAVIVNQKALSGDAINESFLVDVDAPSVEVKSIQYTLQPSGQILRDQRALLINKKRTESISVSIAVTDSMNQTFVRQMSFPATATAPAVTPTPAPAPVATPTTVTTPGATPTPAPTPAPVALPDLAITSISWSPASIVERTPVRFAVIVKNFGSAPTPSGVTLGVGFFVDNQPANWSGSFTSSLAPGASVTLVSDGGANNGLWLAQAGNHTITAHVDDVNRIAESNESNNFFNGVMSVGPAPIVHLRSRVNNLSYIDASSSASGTPMQVWTAFASPNQDFQYTANSELRVHGKCLAASAAASGSVIVLADCNGSAIQKFDYNAATGELKNSNGLCVDLPNSVTTNGTRVNLFTCNAGVNQKWDMVP
jgi:hypothetical protein